MKRAILVTTGTVVGVASVLAYKPDAATLSLIPGTESLVTSSSVSANETPSATASSTTAEPTADVTTQATPSGTSSDGTTAAATTQATASASAKATASTTARATATPSASASATSTPSASSSTTSGSASVSDVSSGTYSGSTQSVVSRGHNYGTLVATVTVSDGRMTALSFQQTPTGRNEQFINAVNTYLVPEILSTQNVTVGVVTGATATSMALIYSLQDALGLA